MMSLSREPGAIHFPNFYLKRGWVSAEDVLGFPAPLKCKLVVLQWSALELLLGWSCGGGQARPGLASWTVISRPAMADRTGNTIFREQARSYSASLLAIGAYGLHGHQSLRASLCSRAGKLFPSTLRQGQAGTAGLTLCMGADRAADR